MRIGEYCKMFIVLIIVFGVTNSGCKKEEKPKNSGINSQTYEAIDKSSASADKDSKTNDETSKTTEKTKTKKTWKLGEYDLYAFFEKFQKYASFEGNVDFNTSCFTELVTEDCLIITNSDSNHVKGKITETPLEHAGRILRLAFSNHFFS